METMSDKVLAMHCFLDDFLQEAGKNQTYKAYHCSKAVILTMALVAARFFYGNQASAQRYMCDKQGIRMVDKSGFNRRLHSLTATLESLFYYLAGAFKNLNMESQYVIDSFPVPVCDNVYVSPFAFDEVV